MFVCGDVWGKRVSLELAEHYAHNWWLQKDGNRQSELLHIETEFDNIYLFVETNGRGFVMLAADDRSLPVLGYSLKNNFVIDSMPIHVHDWILDYNDQIQWLIDHNIEKTKEINAQWKDLENEKSKLPNAYPSGKMLNLTTTWNQGSITKQSSAYNYLCPQTGGKSTYSGCVATAMAQILKYYNWPVNGVGSHSYNWNSQTLSANFANTTYDWANMLNNYAGSVTKYSTAQRDAIATLMYHVGVAVEMDYGTSGSGAYVVATTYDEAAAVNAYKKYFKYKYTATSVYIGDYTTDGWKLMLKNEIDNNRPVQYSGRSASGGGHSFVCQGYNTDELFYINWGWGGSQDGYFAMGSLNTSSSGTGGNNESEYSIDNKAVIGIEPDRSTTNTVSITASSNNTAYGTISPSGTRNYTRFVSEVSITPSAKSGCRFVNWSIGSTEVPLKFLASGDNATIVANFERLGGDTLYYCRDGYVTAYRWGNEGSMQYWGIRIPAGCLSSEKVLTDVMLYVYQQGTYTLRVYTGAFSTLVYSETFNVSENGKWVTLPLTTIQAIDVTKDLCVAFESNASFPCSISISSTNSYATYGHSSGSSVWNPRSNSGEYTWMIKAITAPIHKISTDPTNVRLTSASKDLDLRSANLGVSNKGATVSYEVVSCNPDGIATITDGYKITSTGTGTVKVKAKATDSKFGYAESIVELQVGKGTLVFDGYAGNNWSNPGSWGPHHSKLPNANDFDVQVDVVCNVDDYAECDNLTMGTTGSITVESDAVLMVSGKFLNNDASKLLIKADENGSGTVWFAEGTPKATVEMYFKGTATSDGNGGYIDPEWQLRGSVAMYESFALVNPEEWANIHVYKWDETKNANGCWTDKMVGSDINLEPWVGYGFANYSTTPATVKYSGTLDRYMTTLELTKTGSGNANVGNNMLTNSYAAPVKISNLVFDGPKASVIFYNTGSLLDWQQYEGDTTVNVGTLKGQMLVCPQKTSGAAGLPTAIPAGQSFYVVTDTHGGSIELDYGRDALADASGPMFMPERKEEFNVLGITINGKKGCDRLVLVENENCDDNYNDGYDGMKYIGDADLPQLFALNAFGKTSINASKTLLGQKIGVTSSEAGEFYTMTFETDKLSGFAQLQLFDHVTGRYVDVLAGGKYEFVTTGKDEERFEVVGFRMRDGEDKDENMWVYGNHLFVGDNEGLTTMCDMSGKIVWQANVRKEDWIDLPEMPFGVYVIKTKSSTIKIVR